MLFNFICLVYILLIFLISKSANNFKYNEIMLKIFGTILCVYKLAFYVLKNIKGNFTVPVEISSISYFLVPIILVFKLKKLYVVGSFFGIISGIGYFVFYAIVGYNFINTFSVSKIVVACIAHGYLLLAGLRLFKQIKFKKDSIQMLWITIFAMLTWELIYRSYNPECIAFIYYLITPTFLLSSNNIFFNLFTFVAYYSFIVIAFNYILKLFYKINNTYHKTDIKPIKFSL